MAMSSLFHEVVRPFAPWRPNSAQVRVFLPARTEKDVVVYNPGLQQENRKRRESP